MSAPEEANLIYEVSDEMLARFAQSTLAQRIQWLDEMRTFSWEMASPEVRQLWRNARAAGRWDGEQSAETVSNATRSPRAP